MIAPNTILSVSVLSLHTYNCIFKPTGIVSSALSWGVNSARSTTRILSMPIRFHPAQRRNRSLRLFFEIFACVVSHCCWKLTPFSHSLRLRLGDTISHVTSRPRPMRSITSHPSTICFDSRYPSSRSTLHPITWYIQSRSPITVAHGIAIPSVPECTLRLAVWCNRS